MKIAKRIAVALAASALMVAGTAITPAQAAPRALTAQLSICDFWHWPLCD